MKDFSSRIRGFTLVELVVSIVISVLVLGGIFYFIGDVLLGLARTSGEGYFLDDFYEFTTLLESGKFEQILDYPELSGMDVGIISSGDNKTHLLVGVVNHSTMKLVKPGESQFYGKNILGYANISTSVKQQIKSNPQESYDISFFKDKIFKNMYIADLQVSSYNSGSIHDFYIVTFPYHQSLLDGTAWEELPKEDLLPYRLSF